MTGAMLGAMDKDVAQQRLAQVERHVALGDRHIENQCKLIAKLARLSRDTNQTELLLRTLEDTQRLHLADRDRLRKELDNASRP
jgi:hypothetical protein